MGISVKPAHPKRLHLIANTKSGRGLGATLPAICQQICDELGAEFVNYKIDSFEELEKQIDLAIDNASLDGGVVVAAGGDGTIRSVAQKAAGRAVNFAVVAVGTFNFFARTHLVPDDPAEAFRLALTGDVRSVRLGEVNGKIFLINASFGLYAKAIREREAATTRFGRNRLVVILSTIFTFLKRHRMMKVELATSGQQTFYRTPMIFVGNNALQLRDLAMDVAQCMKSDLLAVVMLKPLKKMEILRVIFRGFTKTIENEDSLETFCADSLTIHTNRHHQMVALDGEIFRMTSPLRIRARPGILNMVLPKQIAKADLKERIPQKVEA